MAYSFQNEVIKSLPTGHRFIRMVSGANNTTIVHTVKNAVKHELVMPKMDISRYFYKIPTISIPENSSYNDLYELISERYGLGLQKNIDFYNSSTVPVTESPVYMELPVNESCCAYYGNIRCYVLKHNLYNGNLKPVRDLTSTDGSTYLNKLKIKSYFIGKLICLADHLTIGKTLTPDIVELLVSDMDSQTYPGASDSYRYILSDAKVIDLFNDGISDILLIETFQGLLSIRYSLN